MKKLQITLFSLAVLFAAACSKHKGGSNENYRIKQAVYPTLNLTDTYEYNKQNQITRINHSDGRFESAVYNSTGQLTVYEEGGNASATHNYRTDYINNTAGIVQEEITTRGDGFKSKVAFTITNGLQTGYKFYTWIGGAWSEDVSSAATYSYNGANQRIKLQAKSYYSLFEYDERGNLTNSKLYQMKSDKSGFYLASVTHYTFDNKKRIDDTIERNPFFNNKNNQLDVTSTSYAENGMINSQQSTTISYEYNAADYVTKAFINGDAYSTYTLELAGK